MQDSREHRQFAAVNVLFPAVVVILGAVLGYLVYSPSLETARPPSPGAYSAPPPPSAVGLQAVYARLWEDPFAPTSRIRPPSAATWRDAWFRGDTRRLMSDRSNVRQLLQGIVEGQHQAGAALHVLSAAAHPQHVADKWQWLRRCSYWLAKCIRTTVAVGFFFAAGVLALIIWGWPFQPTRGWFSGMLANGVLYGAVLVMLFLLFSVLDGMQTCRVFVKDLAMRPGRWPEPAIARLRRGDSYPEDLAEEVLTIRLAAKYTRVVGKSVILPFVVIFLMVISRLTVFDNWDVPWPLLLIFGAMFSAVIWAAFSLRHTAEAARQRILSRLRDGLAVQIGAGEQEQIALYQQAIEEIRNESEGAFRPLIHDPIVRAIAIPFGGVGGVVLIEQLTQYLYR